QCGDVLTWDATMQGKQAKIVSPTQERAILGYLDTTLCGQKTQTSLFPFGYGVSPPRVSPFDFTPTTSHSQWIAGTITEGDRLMDWKTLLACITGSGEEQLPLRNEYVVEENRILRKQIAGRVQLTDADRQTCTTLGTQH